jgi:hypothetical protein
MKSAIWLLECSNGEYFAFRNIEDARDKAYKLLRAWDFDPVKDEDVYKELNESYNNETFAGFYVDDCLWCYQIEFTE